jgi:hypothetical protein
MKDQHWSDDDFLAGLYGIGPPDEHLRACDKCRTRWEMLKYRRERLLAKDAPVPQRFLDRQKLAIYERINRKASWFNLRPAPVLAALLLFFVILSIFRPAPQTRPFVSKSDAEVFEDIFDIASSAEPSALQPVHALFEVEQ